MKKRNPKYLELLNAHSPEVQNHYLMRLVDQPSKELVDVIIKLVTLQKHWAGEQKKKASRTSSTA